MIFNKYATVLCCLLLVVTRIDAIELTDSPIESEMRAAVRQLAPLELSLADGADDFGFASNQEGEGGGSKSVFKAGLYSAILPGAGEFYLGAKKKARVFFVVEAISWIGFASFRTYSGWKKDDFVRFAAVNANAQLEDKSNEFHDLVGFFSDIDEANTRGRIETPGQEFLPDTPENHWRWTSSADQEVYRTLKNRSREANRRADFLLGAAIVNRIVSVVDAVISAKKEGRKIGRKFTTLNRPTYSFRIDPMSRNRQLSFTYYPGF